ncbi:MAG TPA: chloride channel protein, partial [Acidimicrobiales bacterium]|nr:chloride channel protein [Acidimicrobiales bacterium]
LATSLSIGTGGSGGIFGPGMVIGAFVGAAVWRLFEPHFPSMGHNPAAYVIVGMMACFGGISRAPLAVMLMVAEMTGSLSVIPPAMVGVGISWLIVRRADDTMYRSQLADRRGTRAAQVLVGLPLLATVPVRRAMRPPRLVLGETADPADAVAAMEAAGVPAAPVVDGAGRFEGTVNAADLPGARSLRTVVDAAAPVTSLDAQLDAGLEALTITRPAFVPVLDRGRRVHGTLAVSDVVRAYRAELLASLTPADGPSAAPVVSRLEAEPDAPWVGHPLRDGLLPAGVIVTAVQRGDTVLTPDGGTVIQPGDRLSIIGPVSDSESSDVLSGL